MTIQQSATDRPPGQPRFVDFRLRKQASAELTDHAMPVTIFGPFSLDAHNATLTRDGQQLTLTPKAFALLAYLVESSGQLLTKDAIFEQIWPGVIVSDAALTVCISEIRKVLGDCSKTPRFIETVHKRGFRFIHKTSRTSDHQVSHPPAVTRRSAIPHLVGRNESLEILHQCMDKALTGTRQLVFVTGEPGIGKTSIVEAFLSHHHAGSGIQIAKGRCIQLYGASEAYFPILDALSDLARKEHTVLADCITRNAPGWLEHLPAVSGLTDISQRHNSMNTIGPQGMLRELTEVLEAMSEKKPLLLFLDDLHWCDNATIDLLSFLARRENHARILIIGTYRPANSTVRKHPIKRLKEDLQPRGYCTTIPLELLTRQQIAVYLSECYPEHRFPERLTSILHQQSDGNPLFLFNLLSYLTMKEILRKTEGYWQLTDDFSIHHRFVPDDLERMINQQIEQLDPECQTVLETASIASEPGGIAVQFTLAEVERAMDIDELDVESCLEMLANNSHFLQALGETEWPDGSLSSCYEFTHALYQNVLYQRISIVRKAQLHCRLGQVLENGYGRLSDEISSKLAVHFEIGRDYHRAVQYLHKTAETVAQRGANREAIHILDKARQLLTKLPQTQERDRLELSVLLLYAPAIIASKGNATPEIEHCYLRAQQLCEQLNEQSEKFRVLFGLRSFYLIQGELSKAHQLAQTLLGLATELDNADYRLEAHVGLASSEFFAGNLQASHQHALQGIALYDKNNHARHAGLYGLDPGVFCYARAGQTLWPMGFPDQALANEKHAVDLAENLNHPYSLTFAMLNLSQVYLYRRDDDAALKSVLRARSLAVKHGFLFLTAWAYHLTAWAFAMSGDDTNARLEINKALTAERPRATATDTFLAVFLAEAYRLLNDPRQGLSCLATPCREHSYDIERVYLKAEFYLLESNSNEALTQAELLYQKALKASRQQSFKAYELRAAIGLSKLLLEQKRNQEVHDCLYPVTRWFQEGLDTAEIHEAQSLLRQLGFVDNNLVYGKN